MHVTSSGDTGVWIDTIGSTAFAALDARRANNTCSQPASRAACSVTGTLSKGGGSFKIDHPLDPENQYLYHSFVESPDMMNVYNGNVVLDEGGEATVELPEWFEALNRDFRYQLTCIGGFAPVYIAEEIAGNRFRIAGGTGRAEGLLAGHRHPPGRLRRRATASRSRRTSRGRRGRYLHPEAFGQPAELSVGRSGRTRIP